MSNLVGVEFEEHDTCLKLGNTIQIVNREIYVITVIGSPWTGKSSLINAFFGQPIAPTGIFKTTCGINYYKLDINDITIIFIDVEGYNSLENTIKINKTISDPEEAKKRSKLLSLKLGTFGYQVADAVICCVNVSDMRSSGQFNTIKNIQSQDGLTNINKPLLIFAIVNNSDMIHTQSTIDHIKQEANIAIDSLECSKNVSELSVEFIPNNVDQKAYTSACTELFTKIRARLAWHKAYPTVRGFNLTEDPQVWIESLPKILDAISHNKKLMSTASLQSERNKNIYEEVLENLTKVYREHIEQYPTKLIDANTKETFLHDYESAASGADAQIYYNLLSAKLDHIHDEHVNQVKVSVTYKCKMIDTLIVEYFKSKREKIDQAHQSYVALFLECENKFNLLTTDVEQKYIICGWQETITTLFLEKKLDSPNMCTYGNHHCDRPASHQESMEISPEYNIDERYDIAFLWACEHGHFEKVKFLVRNHKKYLHAKKDLASNLACRNEHRYINNWINKEFRVPFKIDGRVYGWLAKHDYINTINYLADYHNINYYY